jgi:hypothetical protein
MEEPKFDNIDELIEYHWKRGWEEAIEYVIDIADEMKYTGYNLETLEELSQRIV